MHSRSYWTCVLQVTSQQRCHYSCLVSSLLAFSDVRKMRLSLHSRSAALKYYYYCDFLPSSGKLYRSVIQRLNHKKPLQDSQARMSLQIHKDRCSRHDLAWPQRHLPGSCQAVAVCWVWEFGHLLVLLVSHQLVHLEAPFLPLLASAICPVSLSEGNLTSARAENGTVLDAIHLHAALIQRSWGFLCEEDPVKSIVWTTFNTGFMSRRGIGYIYQKFSFLAFKSLSSRKITFSSSWLKERTSQSRCFLLSYHSKVFTRCFKSCLCPLSI